jgi:hypothetical protein
MNSAHLFGQFTLKTTTPNTRTLHSMTLHQSRLLWRNRTANTLVVTHILRLSHNLDLTKPIQNTCTLGSPFPVNYLNGLTNNKKAYMEYHEWWLKWWCGNKPYSRSSVRIDGANWNLSAICHTLPGRRSYELLPDDYQMNAVCNVCAKLHTSDLTKPSAVSQRLHLWLRGSGHWFVCIINAPFGDNQPENHLAINVRLDEWYSQQNNCKLDFGRTLHANT